MKLFKYESILIALHILFLIVLFLIANQLFFRSLILISLFSLFFGLFFLKLRKYKVSGALIIFAGFITLPLGILSVGPGYMLWNYNKKSLKMQKRQALIFLATTLVVCAFFIYRA